MKHLKLLKSLFLYLILPFLISSCKSSNLKLVTESFEMKLSPSGQVVGFFNKLDGVNYMDTKQSSPLLKISINGECFEPTKLSSKGNKIVLDFDEQKTKAILTLQKEMSYITFELTGLETSKEIDKIIWGPYNIAISEQIGKSIGVAYNDEFAIGLMGLNLKSCGGFETPERERFGNTAQRIEGGISLQGFTRNRTLPHVENNCLQELISATPVTGSEGQLIGSKFAIYGTPTKKMTNLISEIEKNEKLPYLTHNGEWLKNTLYATSSKFIISFNSENIDECLDLAEKAGITNVYHPGIFETWGTFPVRKKDFPNGYQSVRECAEKAGKRKITLGAHTLSNFLTKNDPLVSPKPHKNLQLAGITTLEKDVSANATEIELADELVRVAYDKDDLNIPADELKANENKNRETFAVKIGDEIIEYSSVTQEGTLILKDCKRGSFGTIPSKHSAGVKAGRLVSHYYKVFFPDIQLQDQVAKNLANFFNETKFERISFDGIEGGMAAGHSRYGCDRFIKVFYDNVANKNIIANASDVMHYSWHYFANMSWGEPWWADNFRESQLDHRLKVQKELEEDLLPRKMGQFSITAKTTLKDIQWVMGLCTGYDAGVDFYISPEGIAENSDGEAILKEIKKWEDVRWAQKLSDKEKKMLRDPFSFYKLEFEGEEAKLIFVESWAPEAGKIQGHDDRNSLPKGVLKERDKSMVSLDYEHVNMQKEPGQPTYAEWDYYCVGEKQKLQFAIRLPEESKEAIKGIYLKIGSDESKIPFTLEPGQYITSQANGQLVHFNKNGKQIATKSTKDLVVENGQNTILFDYEGKGRVAGPMVIVNFMVEKN